LSFYLDTNVIVALFGAEPGTAAAIRWLTGAEAAILISDFAAVEFAAVLSREVRTGAIAADRAHAVLARFDTWKLHGASPLASGTADMQLAERLVRDFATKLQAPDALHLALAVNSQSTLVTLDQRLADAARMRGVPIAMPE
jgi:uncharacterized protein